MIVSAATRTRMTCPGRTADRWPWIPASSCTTSAYPILLRLLRELGITTQESDMSMSIWCGGRGLAYAGGRGLSGLLPSFRAVANPRYLHMLSEVTRFHRRARRLLAGDDDTVTLSEFVARGRFLGTSPGIS
jgi:predicted NAD/FAD-binding protein